jgi:hypothetical protein
MNTWTAEWIASRKFKITSNYSRLVFAAIKCRRFIFSSNARSAVRVFTGEAGEAFELSLAVFAVKPQQFFKEL